jgi:hypothetical protein
MVLARGVREWDYSLPDYVRLAHEHLPGSQLVTFENSGHLPFWDAADRYHPRCRNFCSVTADNLTAGAAAASSCCSASNSIARSGGSEWTDNGRQERGAFMNLGVWCFEGE